MAFVPARDRVAENSTSNSQTVFTVTGALDTSYRAFSAFMSVGDTTIGGVVEAGVAFKSGVLTYSNTNEVTVTTTLDSKGTFSSSGTKEVFMGLPALRTLMMDGVQSISSTLLNQLRTNIGALGTVKVQKFTASGTYTPSTGMLYCVIECVGGGGGGGGCAPANASSTNAGGGGGAGAYSIKVATASDIGASKAVTVGAAGSAGSAGNNAGGAGGDTFVGATLGAAVCAAKGGSGGAGAPSNDRGAGGAGGILTGAVGDVTVQGQAGQPGFFGLSSSIWSSGGGGSTRFGAGATATNVSSAGSAATGFGGGGSGGSDLNNVAQRAGGAGTAGIIFIREFCTQ